MPIGVLSAEHAEYMDALDGGAWSYGDDRFPEIGVTFFAGTYVRHPLAMAASHAMLTFLKTAGGTLQQELNARTERLVAELNSFLRENAPPIRIETFSSMFIVKFASDFPFGGLLFFHLREKGIHAWENRLFFLSTAHSEADLERFVEAFRESIFAMQFGGFLPTTQPLPKLVVELEPVRESAAIHAGPVAEAGAESTRPLQFSLYFFGNYPAPAREDKYRLIFEATRFADTHGFTAVWLPERHFHEVGGFSPNAAVMAAALARETSQIQLRAGSVVLPLHHPVRVAEEWALVDNLSAGRVGVSIASGWHPNDFVFAPDAYAGRREQCVAALQTIRQLWRGESVRLPGGTGTEIDVQLFPRPVQPELPVWLTCAQADSFVKAGEQGLNVLAQLQNQTFEEVATRVRLYREARVRAGHDRGHVTILLHTFVAETQLQAQALTRAPLKNYLRAHVEISQRKLGSAEVNAADLDFLLERAVDDYASGKAFIGTPEACAEVAEKLRAIGVDEVGCLIDFGVNAEAVLASLPRLDALRQRFAAGPKHFPLTDAQRGLFLAAARSGDASRAYNESSALELRGPLDVAALHTALQKAVGRHDALRTTIDASGETQTVQPPSAVHLQRIDCATNDKLARELAAVRALQFDFPSAPALDARLLVLAPERHVLLLTFHHLFGNGPSYVAFFEDLFALYHDSAALLPAALQLGDFVRWQGEQADASAFWLEQFRELPPVLDLPLDRARPALRTFRGARATMRLEAAEVTALRSAGARHGASLFITLLSGFQTLLHRLAQQDDVVVGVPFDSPVRSLPGGDRLFANTTNVVPVRSRVVPATTFPELLAQNRDLVLAAHEQQHHFFGRLIETLALPFDASRSPLFAAFFNYESGRYHREIGGLQIDLANDAEPWLSLRDTAMFELGLNVSENEGALTFRCDFNRDLFDDATVQRWLGHLRTLLRSVAVNPAQRLCRLPLLDDGERQNLLVARNATRVDFPRNAMVQELIEAQAERTPDAVAVVFGEQRWTYRDLNARANQLARFLQKCGTDRETPIGVCLERSAEMIIALLACWKAGAPYLPLDPVYPRARLATMLTNSGARLLITQGTLGLELPAECIQLDRSWAEIGLESAANAPSSGESSDLAYIIYTSGSTGAPKGIEIAHRALVNFFHAMQQEPGLDATDTMLALTTVSFDIAALELFLPLTVGARVQVLSREEASDPARLAGHLAKATVAQATPATWRLLLQSGWQGHPGLKVLCGGEALAPELARDLLPRCGELWNMYGPTETTVWSLCQRIAESDAPISVGHPIANTEAYVLDEALQPVPPGIPGQLYLGGEGLARGYRGLPELTREKFVAHPFRPDSGERLYATGDLAQWRADGQLVCLGRIDQQVKLRGFRIELGEIESVLAEHPAVCEVAVVPHQEGPAGEPRLVAYLVATGPLPAAQELRTFLKIKLPDYMLPAAFVFLESLPLLANGKLDRRALPLPEETESTTPADFVAPRNATEERVAEVWRHVLKVPQVSVHDDFFDLGGHSLTAMQAVTRLRATLHPSLSFHHLFECPTIDRLVRRMSLAAAEETVADEELLEEGIL